MSLLCSCFFGLILQDPLGDEAVEELDEGPRQNAQMRYPDPQDRQEPAEQAQKASVKTRQPKYWKCV